MRSKKEKQFHYLHPKGKMYCLRDLKYNILIFSIPTKKSFHHSSGIPLEFHWSHGKLLEKDWNKWNLWNSSEIPLEFQQFII